MDRSKLPAKKTKAKSLIAGDVIALGSKRPGSETDLGKKGVHGTLGKRELLSSTSLAAKKPKLSDQIFTRLGRNEATGQRTGSPARQLEQFDEIAVEVEPGELYDSIVQAEDDDQDLRVEGLICGAVRYLKANRAKPDPLVFLTLMYLAKRRPLLFASDIIIEAFCSLLKRDLSINFKSKGNPLVSTLACNVLMMAYQDEETWPEAFLRVYVDDAMGERVWVERQDCRSFVENILTAFNTVLPPALFETKTDNLSLQAGASPKYPALEEDSQSGSGSRPGSSQSDISMELPITFPRYTYHQSGVENYILEFAREHLGRRQVADSMAKNMIKVLTVCCGNGEIRMLASQRLEMWLQNPKLSRVGQDLLMSVCINCKDHSQADVEIMAMLLKIRLKHKPMITHYLQCIRELLNQHPSNLQTLLTHTIYNELSNARNPNNMLLIQTIFTHASLDCARVLADILLDLLINKDDYLRALRALLREIVRTLRHEINFKELCLGLMHERSDTKFTDLEPQYQERLMLSICDMVTLCQLLCITPGVREAASAHARDDQKDLAVLQSFQNQLSVIQRDAIWWLHTIVPQMYKIKSADYVHCVHKVLFMAEAEHYYNKDNWPPEGDRSHMLRLTAEVPILEDTLMRLLIIGLSRELPVNAVDALELADQLVKRAAALGCTGKGFEVLKIERAEFFDALLNLCTYHYPENITLPKGYVAPTLAVANSYWKAWVICLIIAAFNPTKFGMCAWENYPMLRCIMEMVMTNTYTFPPPTFSTDDKSIEDIRNKEKQIAMLEKQEILQFETYLAAATNPQASITESNSLLLTTLTSMDPSGIARKPPHNIIEHMKSINQSLKIGQMLCRSRDPDFLLDIIQRQGTSQLIPWLAELVESSEGSLEVLPVQCLCEFLLHDAPDTLIVQDTDDEDSKTEEKMKLKKKHKAKMQKQLLAKLQDLVHSEESSEQPVCEVMDYFLKKLVSQQTKSRVLAVKGLSMVLNKDNTGDDVDKPLIPEHAWLLKYLPTIHHFEAVKEGTCTALRKACQLDTDHLAVAAYIVFLTDYGASKDQQLQSLDDLAFDLSQLIVERSTMLNHILPGPGNNESTLGDDILAKLITLFSNYMKRAKAPEQEAYSWSDTQDQIILRWSSGDEATMNILVVHAMIILLSYGKPRGGSAFTYLLETWFPLEGNPPTAYLVDTSEEALLLPDWLKLRMIRSKVDRLVDAALNDLECSQLLLFVQSFGIPVQSMSKLLQCLDEAILTESNVLETIDKQYMSQLVEVQHMRGAVGGEQFKAYLNKDCKSEEHAEPECAYTPVPCLKRQPSQLEVKHDVCSLPADVEGLQTMIRDIFVHSSAGKSKQFALLLKELHKSQDTVMYTVEALSNLMIKPEGDQFVQAFHKSPAKACPLLQIISLQKGHVPEIQSTITHIMEALTSGMCHPAVKSIAVQYMRGIQGELAKKSDVLSSKNVSSTFIKELQKGESSHSKIESLIHKCMDNTYIDLQKKDPCSSSDEKRSYNNPSTGLFIDWIELLDPEIISSCPELQQKFLFMNSKEWSPESTGSPHPYLLALLTHQGSWVTINKCIDKLLGSFPGRYASVAVLDFLWACIYIPKIWQGRDRKLPKNHKPENILCLNASQMYTVIEHIINETSRHESKEDKLKCVSARMDLVLSCLYASPILEHVLVMYLQDKVKTCPRELCYLYEHIMMHMYLHKPHLSAYIGDVNSLMHNIRSTQIGICQLDTISHRLLTNLAETMGGKQAVDRMYDANIGCRNMASHHPLLMLRQLPMIAGLLQGRVNFNFEEFRTRNHLLLYTHILGLLDLLKPQIFRKEYSASLEAVMKAYFEVIKIHGLQQRELGPLIIKFVHFLHHFVHHDNSHAGLVLLQHIALLSSVLEMYPELTILKSLLAGLSLTRQNDVETDIPLDGAVSMMPPRPTSPFTTVQLAPFLKKIGKGAKMEDVLEVLDDLDKTSKRKVDILEHFVNELKRLMISSNEQCRTTAHVLIMRHIRQNPSSSADFLSTYLHCLDNSNQEIVSSALKNIPEFVVLCQENTAVLLQKVFAVGTETNIETGACISETIHLLNNESSYIGR